MANAASQILFLQLSSMQSRASFKRQIRTTQIFIQDAEQEEGARKKKFATSRKEPRETIAISAKRDSKLPETEYCRIVDLAF